MRNVECGMRSGVLDFQVAATGLRGTVALRPIGNRWPARRPSSTPCGEGGELILDGVPRALPWAIVFRPFGAFQGMTAVRRVRAIGDRLPRKRTSNIQHRTTNAEVGKASSPRPSPPLFGGEGGFSAEFVL